MHAAITTGCNIFNGGETYGTPEYNSLTLLKAYYEKYPEDVGKVVVNIKSGTKGTFGLDGSAEYAKESVDRCLKLLGDRGKIDIFEYARRDTSVPLTVTLGALAECVEEGKIGGVALSEVNANTIREAAKITKIVAVETELSIFSTGPLTNGICAACAELGIQIHAYSPLGRGMLTGRIKSPDDIHEGDNRKMLPRFSPENFAINLKLVEEVEKIAAKKGCTPSHWHLAGFELYQTSQGCLKSSPFPELQLLNV